MTRTVVSSALALALTAALTAHAQRRGQAPPREKPKVDVVQSAGCAERKSGNPETWWLTRASDPKVTALGVFSVSQVEEAGGSGLGGNIFQLVGVADFLDTEGLVRSGRRAEFTTAETANATGQLREGRKVLVKGLLIEGGEQKRINLITVIALADTCL